VSATATIKATLRAAVFALGLVAVAWVLRPSPPAPRADDVMVFAAASLREVMQELGDAFEREHTSGVRLNLAGSNVLARQIVAASGADVFVSADDRWMDQVEAAGRVIEGSRRAILANRLVVVAPASSDWRMDEPADLATLDFAHLAIADPDAVPAGRYARAFLSGVALDEGSLWSALADRVVPTVDVRAALALVEADPSTVGIVYRTDAAAAPRTRILYEVAGDATPPIRYYAARIERADAPAAARRFYELLFSPGARDIFARHGFVVLGDEPSSR
jgi:molybdate transport system substrate-binding protein